MWQRGPDKSRRAPRARLWSKSKISAVFTNGDYEPRVSKVHLCSESLGYKCLSIAHTLGRLSAHTWGRPAVGGARRRCSSLLHRHAIGIRFQSGAIYPAVCRCNRDPGPFLFPFFLLLPAFHSSPPTGSKRRCLLRTASIFHPGRR